LKIIENGFAVMEKWVGTGKINKNLLKNEKQNILTWKAIENGFAVMEE